MTNKNVMLIDDFTIEHEDKIANTLKRHLPMGMLIVNESCEILFANQRVERFFKEELQEDKAKFGNKFHCRTVSDSRDLCGTRRGCKSCKLNIAFMLARANNKCVENISYEGVFGQGENRERKWFNLSIMPIEDTDQYIILLNDQSSLLSLKIDADVKNAINEQNSQMLKHEFHDEVIEIIESQSYNRNPMYFLHIKVCDLDLIKNQLGQLWVEDFTFNIYRKLMDLKEIRDLICKMTEDDIIIYFKDKNLVEVNEFIASVNSTVSHRLYQHVNLEQHVIEVALNDTSVRRLVAEDKLHMTYFEMLKNIMNSNEVYQKYQLS